MNNQNIGEQIAFLINEFIEKRCDRVFLRKSLQALLIVERTSLLGEVGEKVIGRNEEYIGDLRKDFDLMERNKLRAEQRTKLSVLEDVGGGK